MALKQFKPTTPGRRGLVMVDRSGLWKGKPLKALTIGMHGKGGRNNFGRVTARRRGGGHKRRYRLVDFKRAKFDVPATVERLQASYSFSRPRLPVHLPQRSVSWMLLRDAPFELRLRGDGVDAWYRFGRPEPERLDEASRARLRACARG